MNAGKIQKTCAIENARTHTLSLSLSLSLSDTHTHTHTQILTQKHPRMHSFHADEQPPFLFGKKTPCSVQCLKESSYEVRLQACF